MVNVINEYTGMSAEKPRKEIIVSASFELGGIVAGHGSVAYCIADGKVAVFDEDSEAWIDTDGNTVADGSSNEGDTPSV